LHFGRVDHAVLAALGRELVDAKLDLLVVSGDLTQRAQKGEFQAAREFLSTLPRPQLVVPGNHDIPLYNLWVRWLTPLDRYRRYINADLEPSYVDDEIAVLGINTARANTFKNGRINERQMTRSSERLKRCGPNVTRVVVTHHPFDIPKDADGSPVGQARIAVVKFTRSRVDLILSGHLHGSSARDSTARYGESDRSILLVQAGTATSTRRRGELNSFNFLRIDEGAIQVDCMVWDESHQQFSQASSRKFRRAGGAWSEAFDGLPAR
jgi:3',5'-cyclic AMP phosphodiesterase CpdA